MNTPKFFLMGKILPYSSTSPFSFLRPTRIENSCWAITESTSISILLNSSKQAQAPCCARPENNLLIICAVIWSEQLKTMQTLANPFARSFVDYVLPVPAGPAGAAPRWLAIALVIVIQHLSVKGVMTSLVVAPRYS